MSNLINEIVKEQIFDLHVEPLGAKQLQFALGLEKAESIEDMQSALVEKLFEEKAE